MKDAQEQQNKIDEIKIVREVSIQAEALYEDSKQLGDLATLHFGDRHRAQITGLESIAESTFKTSDILDYIKRQSARQEHWRKDNFGRKLIATLETLLESRRNTICNNLGIGNKTDDDRQERRRIYLLLMRQFIRQMAVEYEYQVSYSKGEGRNGAH